MKTPLLIFYVFLLLSVGTRTLAQVTPVALPPGLQPAIGSEMTTYNNELYMVLQNPTHTIFYLYRFDGTTFTYIPLPPNYKLYADTEFEELNGKLHFMPRHNAGDATAEILAYDGTSFIEIHIPTSVLPPDSLYLYGHRPFAYNGKLYIEAAYDLVHPIDLETRYLPYWIMYDGTTFTRRLLNAPLMTFAPYYIPMPASDKIQYQGKLYTRYYDYITNMFQAAEYNGTTVTRDPSHYGIIAYPGKSEMIVYNGILYIPTTADGYSTTPASGLNRFDGTLQTQVTLPAGLTYVNTSYEVYADKLWGAMNDGSGTPQLYSYNGVTYTHVNMPLGATITPASEFRSFACKLYFSGTTGATISGIPVFTLYQYEDVPYCSTPVWPRGLGRFEDIRFDLNSRGDDWCWTNINIKWPEIVPCKLPDCIDPLFRVTLSTDPKDIYFSKEFEKPFELTLPDNNKTAYITSIALGTKTGDLTDVVVFDKELIPAGITAISIYINPKKKTFTLTADALKGKKVPFTMLLLNADGQTIWKQEFTAPVNTDIKDVTDQVGTTLRFTTSVQLPKGKRSVAVYPNPAVNQVQINIDTDEPKTPARIRITNAQGIIVYDKTVIAPVSERPASLAPGIYIVHITIGKEEYTNRLVVKPGL